MKQQYLILALLCLIIINFSWKKFRNSELFLYVDVTLFPRKPEKHFILGHFLFEKNKNLKRAEQELRQAIALAPQDRRYVMVLAFVLQKSQKYLEAIDNYQLLVKLDTPNEGVYAETAYLNMGLMFHEILNRFDRAEEAYRKAIEINPTNPESNFQLGWLLLDRLHRDEEAEVFFLKTLELNPKDETAMYNLACIRSTNRDSESTFIYLRKAIENGFDRVWARDDKDFEWLHNDLRFNEIVGPDPKTA